MRPVLFWSSAIFAASMLSSLHDCTASAQQRRFYDASGRSLGTASTDSQGTTTVYDARGNVVGRAAKTGDARGNSVGRSSSR